MIERFSTAAAVIASTLIVGGAMYALLRHAAPMLNTTPTAETAAQPKEQPAVLRREPAPATAATSARFVYRCDEGGRVVYSDTPCNGAKTVEIQHTKGWESPRRFTQARQVLAAQAGTTSPLEPSAGAEGRRAECIVIESQIAQIDAAARVGGTIPFMEELKERRRKLVDRKYELSC